MEQIRHLKNSIRVNKRYRILLTIIFVFFCGLLGIGSYVFLQGNSLILRPITEKVGKNREKPLEKYSYEHLKQRVFPGSALEFGDELERTGAFTSRMFSFTSDGKKVSGLAHFPAKPGTYPVIVQFRGFVPPEIFQSGVGTQHSAQVFAQNGFISLAPDFLGYGESASPSGDVMEERFETYTTALTLLASVKNLNQSLRSSDISHVSADETHIGIWAHSNGGQIALTVLETSGVDYPTVLWVPVSKPFPYSILYYTDDIEDHGKALRRVVSDFEKEYDSENYSLTNYLDWINAPIELHQGTGDEAVPFRWSDELYKNLKDRKKDITYYTYPGDDHNFSKGNWGTVVAKNIRFYRNHFTKPT